MDTAEGTLCWIEIPAKDIVKVYDFYKAGFPEWEFREEPKPTSDEHQVVHITFSKNSKMSGGIVQLPKDCPVAVQSMGSGLTPYYLVNSIEVATERLEKLGAKTVLPKQDESGSGWFANLLDVEGNRFGLYQVQSPPKSS